MTTPRPLGPVRRVRRALAWMWGELAPPGGPAALAGLAALAMVALGLPACNTGNDDDTAAAGGAASSSPVGPPAPATADLEPMLLTLEDMPSGWAALPLDDGEPMCGPDVDSVAAAFTEDLVAGPAVGIELAHGGAGLFDDQAAAMDGCEADRGGLHFAFTPLNTAQVGDRSAGFRATVTRPGIPDEPVGFTQDMVLVQVGDVVGLVQVITRGTGDPAELLARYSALAAERIQERL